MKLIAVVVPVIALLMLLSVPSASLAQEQSWSDVNDVVQGGVADCAAYVVEEAFADDVYWIWPAQTGSFWSCVFYDGWPDTDVVPDSRLDRPIWVAESVLRSIRETVAVTAAVLLESPSPDWSQFRLIECRGWIAVELSAYLSMSEVAQTARGEFPSSARCNTTSPDFTAAPPFEADDPRSNLGFGSLRPRR